MIADLADRIALVYAGLIVEEGRIAEVLDAPLHPYTLGLLDRRRRTYAPIAGEIPSPHSPPPTDP